MLDFDLKETSFRMFVQVYGQFVGEVDFVLTNLIAHVFDGAHFSKHFYTKWQRCALKTFVSTTLRKCTYCTVYMLLLESLLLFNFI